MSRESVARARRDHIADTVIQLAASQGVASVTLRNVAKAAGVSMGQVQYHFDTVAELIAFSLERSIDRLGESVEHLVREHERPNDLLGLFRAFTLAFLADDDAVRDVMRVITQYESTPDPDPRIGDILNRDDEETDTTLADALRKGIDLGLLNPRIDPAQEVRMFWLTLGGLASEVAAGRRDREEAIALMRYSLMRLAIDQSP